LKLGLLNALNVSGRRPQSAAVALITNYVPTTLRNDITGHVGLTFTTVAAITISELGRWVVSGNSQSHTISLVKWSDKSVVASAVVATAGATPGQFLYAACTPVTLLAATYYAIVSTETSGGDQWYNASAGNQVVFTSGTYSGYCYSTSTIPNLVDGGVAARPFGPPDAKYTS